MKKQKWLIVLTAAGLLGTTAAAGASGLVEKVTGILHNDVAVSVDGEGTALHPVYIDGKAYLPARDTAEALGYSLSWNSKEIQLRDKQPEQEAEAYVRISGVITSAEADGDKTRIEVLGHGPNTWIILTADKDTVVTGQDGKPYAVKDLKPGLSITAEYGPIIAMSYPGQSHAASIQVAGERLIQEGAVYTAGTADDGSRQIQFSELKDGVETPSLTLTAGKETMVVSEEGQPVDWSQLKPGTQVRAYYGPIMTKSIPPQSPLFVLVVLGEQPDPASVKAYRELAWTLVPEDQKPHLLTKRDEAQVSIIAAKGAAIMPADDKQKQVLADLAAQDGKLISVTYSTDQDALLGPLQIAINPDTKELVGFFIRM